MARPSASGVGAGLLAVALCAVACAERQLAEVTAAAEPFAALDTESWVRVYEPERASNGYTLAFYKRRVPILLDMNGTVVHAWPEARAKSRLRLLPDGSLLTISLSREVVEYDWDGRLVWQHREPRRLPHHDVIRLANGNTLVLALRRGVRSDELLEVDRGGEIVWEWSSSDHLEPYFPGGRRSPGKTSHINSVQELPENPLYTAGDERFRPGNLLISARNLSTIFVLDRRSGDVLWSYRGALDYQHEAYMIPPGQPGNGRILIFDNRPHDAADFPQSEVLEIDPGTGAVTWRYTDDGFYSPTGGVEQPLPNGNVLIASSRGGRAFEVTRGGDVVWSWSPPFDPNRPQRYPPNHTPQLAALSRSRPIAVLPPAGYRHIDDTLFRFGDRSDRQARRIGGRQRAVLSGRRLCRPALLPEAAEVGLAFGVDRRAYRRAGREVPAARFAFWMNPLGSSERIDLFADTVGAEGASWREVSVSLAEHSYSKASLCVEVDADQHAYWSPPVVRSAAAPAEAELILGELTADELAARKQHLEALGYVD